MEAIALDQYDLGSPYDLLPIGVVAFNRRRQVTIWNRQMESWSGVPRSNIINRTLGELFSDLDHVTFSDRLNDVFDHGKCVVLSSQSQGPAVPLNWSGGCTRAQQAVVAPILGPDGDRWALIAVQDVTDLTAQIHALQSSKDDAAQAANRAEEAKRLAERRSEQLAEANRELEQFAYLASHDLQEPLRTLTCFSGFLRADLEGALPETAARDLDHIVSAATRMRRLIDGLLALSRVSRSAMSWSRTSLSRCVSEALESLDVGAYEVKPTIVGADTLPTVMGDRGLLTQVFQNLLSNAIKFSDSSRPSVVRLSAEHDGARWLIKLEDNGIGVSEQYLTKIFAPFQRLHGADKYPGSGMGLAICKRAIERHGGAVSVVPNEPVGSCFQFTLPDSQERP
jgi:signal transduction histidine kinase